MILVCNGSECDELNLSKSSPECPTDRTSLKRAVTSQMGHELTFPKVATGEHLAGVIIRATQPVAILLPLARGLQHADKGPARP